MQVSKNYNPALQVLPCSCMYRFIYRVFSTEAIYQHTQTSSSHLAAVSWNL